MSDEHEIVATFNLSPEMTAQINALSDEERELLEKRLTGAVAKWFLAQINDELERSIAGEATERPAGLLRHGDAF